MRGGRLPAFSLYVAAHPDGYNSPLTVCALLYYHGAREHLSQAAALCFIKKSRRAVDLRKTFIKRRAPRIGLISCVDLQTTKQKIDHLICLPLPVFTGPDVCQARKRAKQIVRLDVVTKHAGLHPTQDQSIDSWQPRANRDFPGHCVSEGDRIFNVRPNLIERCRRNFREF